MPQEEQKKQEEIIRTALKFLQDNCNYKLNKELLSRRIHLGLDVCDYLLPNDFPFGVFQITLYSLNLMLRGYTHELKYVSINDVLNMLALGATSNATTSEETDVFLPKQDMQYSKSIDLYLATKNLINYINDLISKESANQRIVPTDNSKKAGKKSPKKQNNLKTLQQALHNAKKLEIHIKARYAKLYYYTNNNNLSITKTPIESYKSRLISGFQALENLRVFCEKLSELKTRLSELQPKDKIQYLIELADIKHEIINLPYATSSVKFTSLPEFIKQTKSEIKNEIQKLYEFQINFHAKIDKEKQMLVSAMLCVNDSDLPDKSVILEKLQCLQKELLIKEQEIEDFLSKLPDERWKSYANYRIRTVSSIDIDLDILNFQELNQVLNRLDSLKLKYGEALKLEDSIDLAPNLITKVNLNKFFDTVESRIEEKNRPLPWRRRLIKMLRFWEWLPQLIKQVYTRVFSNYISSGDKKSDQVAKSDCTPSEKMDVIRDAFPVAGYVKTFKRSSPSVDSLTTMDKKSDIEYVML